MKPVKPLISTQKKYSRHVGKSVCPKKQIAALLKRKVADDELAAVLVEVINQRNLARTMCLRLILPRLSGWYMSRSLGIRFGLKDSKRMDALSAFCDPIPESSWERIWDHAYVLSSRRRKDRAKLIRMLKETDQQPFP